MRRGSVHKQSTSVNLCLRRNEEDVRGFDVGEIVPIINRVSVNDDWGLGFLKYTYYRVLLIKEYRAQEIGLGIN